MKCFKNSGVRRIFQSVMINKVLLQHWNFLLVNGWMFDGLNLGQGA